MKMNTDRMLQLFVILGYDPFSFEGWDEYADFLKEAMEELDKLKESGSALWYVLEPLADYLDAEFDGVLENDDAKSLSDALR